MSKTPWTQLWLDYKKVNSKGNEAYVKSVSLEGFDAEAPVIPKAGGIAAEMPRPRQDSCCFLETVDV